MVAVDVGDFVSQHSGQLVLPRTEIEEGLGHEDAPTRDCAGIRFFEVVNQYETKGDIAPSGLGGEFTAGLLDSPGFLGSLDSRRPGQAELEYIFASHLFEQGKWATGFFDTFKELPGETGFFAESSSKLFSHPGKLFRQNL